MSTITKYKKDIKNAIYKDETDKLGMILSSASPEQRPILRKYIRMYKDKKRIDEVKELNIYNTKKRKTKAIKTKKVARSLYNSKRRRTTKSARTILKGFRLA